MEGLRETLKHVPTEFPDAVLKAFEVAYAPVGALFDQAEVVVREHVKDHRPEYLQAYDNFLSHPSVHAKSLPLMNPFHVVLIILAYLVGLFVLRQVMRFLPPLKFLRPLQILHNFFLVLLSAYMAFEVTRQAIIHHYSLWLNPLDNKPSGWPMAKIIWVFYASKVLEFGDTVFMMLNKNFHQVSFLHVYHHATIFAIWWLVTFMAPGGESYFSAALNSFVHVIMYSYYFCASIKIGCPFKQYITMFQMFQFFLNFVQSIVDLAGGLRGYPTLPIWILFFYMQSLLFLFYNFLQASKRKARQAKEDAASKKETKPHQYKTSLPPKGGKGQKGH